MKSVLEILQEKKVLAKKQGKISLTILIEGVISVILGIVLVFKILGTSSSTIIDAADNVSASGLPFASFFSSSGIVLMAFMIAIVVTILTISFKMKGSR